MLGRVSRLIQMSTTATGCKMQRMISRSFFIASLSIDRRQTACRYAKGYPGAGAATPTRVWLDAPMSEAAPLGPRVPGWQPRPVPEPVHLKGRHVLLRPVSADADAPALFTESHPPAGDPNHWTYLLDGPYRDAAHYEHDLRGMETSRDPLFFTLVAEARPVGLASYLRITPLHGVIEIGNIWFGASLRHRPAGTEAIFLLAAHAFDTLGYRRLEWKCNALNAPSRRAALRYGFHFEGIFKHHLVIKGHNRDTAWYAITDDEWPAVRRGFERWLAPENFDAAGRQRQRLGDLIAA